MDIQYKVWWYIFKFQYSIDDVKDITMSGVYCNNTTCRFECYYVNAKGVPKLITFISFDDVESYSPELASRMMKELYAHLTNYYKALDKPLILPQFDVINKYL